MWRVNAEFLVRNMFKIFSQHLNICPRYFAAHKSFVPIFDRIFYEKNMKSHGASERERERISSVGHKTHNIGRAGLLNRSTGARASLQTDRNIYWWPGDGSLRVAFEKHGTNKNVTHTHITSTYPTSQPTFYQTKINMSRSHSTLCIHNLNQGWIVFVNRERKTFLRYSHP